MPERDVVVVERIRKYIWPELQLQFWALITFTGFGFILGTFAYFMTVQSIMGLQSPWYGDQDTQISLG